MPLIVAGLVAIKRPTRWFSRNDRTIHRRFPWYNTARPWIQIMRRNIPQKFPEPAPVDVSGMKALTPKDVRRQWLDPRSRAAELTASLDHPVQVSRDDPRVGEHLGGHRIFVFAENMLYERVQHLRRYPLHCPNLKALHLNVCVISTQAAAKAKEDFETAINNSDNESAETESMNFMESTVMAMYSGIATLDVFANETIGEKLGRERNRTDELMMEPLDKKFGKILPELIPVGQPHRTRWWPEFQAIRSARNSLTHGGPAEGKNQEKIAQAWSKMLGLQQDIPHVVAAAMKHYVKVRPPWWDAILPRS